MTGPEHYRQAEVLLSNQRRRIGGDDKNELLHPPEQRAEMLAWAQVHATLALTAATVATRAIGPQEAWGGHAIEVDSDWQQATA